MKLWSITLHHLDSGDRSQFLLSADSDIHAYVESMFDDSMTITLCADGATDKEWAAFNDSEYEDCDIVATLVNVETFKVAQ
jgi:hypothetical protein